MASCSAFQPEAYPGSKTALLLLDYQNILINMIQDPEKKQKLIDSVRSLLKTARGNKIAIVHCVMDTNTDPPPTNKISEQWATVHKPVFSGMPELGAEYSEFISEPTSHGGHETTSFRTPGYRSALVGKGLLPLLREELHIEHLVLGGIATSGAILGTASHASDLDFVVSVVEDACWDPNDQVHRALIDTVLPTLAWICTVDEAVARLSG